MGCQQSQIMSYPPPCQPEDIKLEIKRTIRKKKHLNQVIDNCIKSEKTYSQNVKRMEQKLQGKDLLLINETLEKHFLFYKLSKTQKLKLIQCMEKFVAQPKTYIFQEGDQPAYAFFLSQGSAQIIIDPIQKIKKQISTGQLFGDLALLYTAKRSAAVYTKTKCFLWGLSKINFQKKIQQLIEMNCEKAKKLISNNFIFQKCSEQQKTVIANCMNEVKYQKGQMIFRVNEAANSLFVVTSGEIQIQIVNKTNIIMRKGQIFGENCLKKNQYRTGNARSIEDSKCFVISREQLTKCLGLEQFENISFSCVLKWALKRSHIFEHQPKSLLEKIISSGNIILFQDQAILLTKGQKINHMYICLEGRINQLSVGEIIFQNTFDSTRYVEITYRKQGTGAVFVISHKNIDFIFGRSLKEIKSMKSFKKIDTAASKAKIKTMKIELHNLQVIKRFDSNQKSTVLLVAQKTTKKEYILKCVKKNHIIVLQEQIFLQREKKILSKLTNPYVVSLYKTFKDNDYIYMLMKYFQNGDFNNLLDEIGLNCSKNFHMFYAANLILRLEYLYSENVVFRDLKPQNCVLDEEGYLCLIDFGIAKQLNSQTGFRTFSIAGTPHYMAPEIHEGFGYSFQVDIWSLGVIIYYMLFGFLPFGQNYDDPYDIFTSIQTMELSFPTNYFDQNGKQFIERLLRKNSPERIVHDFEELKQMKFFQEYSEIDWKLIRQGTYQSPYTRKQENQIDYLKKSNKHTSILNYLTSQRKNLGIPLKSRKDTFWDEQF